MSQSISPSAAQSIPDEIRHHPSFRPHAPAFSRRIGQHIGEQLNAVRSSILLKERDDACDLAWKESKAGLISGERRTLNICDAFEAWRKGEISKNGDAALSDKITAALDALPAVPTLARWMHITASTGRSAIWKMAVHAAGRAWLMSDDDLDTTAAELGITGDHAEARRARLRDARWLCKAARRQMRKYREQTWSILAPLKIRRASPDGIEDSREQDEDMDIWIRDHGQLINEETGEIVQLPDRAEQLQRKRAELIARQRGMIEKAKRLKLAGYIVTTTCPSRFHPTTTAGGTRRLNPHFDPSLTVSDGHKFLCYQFRALGRFAAKNDIPIFGMRAAHPHADGCAHHHFVLLIHPADARRVEGWLKVRFEKFGVTQIDMQRLTSRRGDDPIEAAMAYSASYLSPRSSGEDNDKQSKGALYQAWRRAHNIREFAFFELGIGARRRGLVSAYRIIRRKKSGPLKIVEAATAGRWDDFERECERADVKLIYKSIENQYGETRNRLCGVQAGGQFISVESSFTPLWKMNFSDRAALNIKASSNPKTAPKTQLDRYDSIDEEALLGQHHPPPPPNPPTAAA